MTELKEKIEAIWGDSSPHMTVYARMLRELKPDAIDYLPLSQLRSLLGENIPNELFDKVVFWFSTDAMPLLDAWYEYLKGEVDEGQISPTKVARALREKELFLESGEVVKDFEDHLFLYFRGTELLNKELHAARRSDD